MIAKRIKQTNSSLIQHKHSDRKEKTQMFLALQSSFQVIFTHLKIEEKNEWKY